MGYFTGMREDETALLATLHGGVHDELPWRTFLGRLQQRCAADVTSLIFSENGGADPMRWSTAAAYSEAIDITSLRSLRPLRVYAFDELHHRDESALRFGRVLKIEGREGWSAWIVLTRSASDVTAADSSLLSALAPHIALAMRTYVLIERQRQRLSIAEDLLQRAGIAWRSRADCDNTTSDAPHADTLVLPNGAVVTRVPTSPGRQQIECYGRLWSLTPAEARFASAIADGKTLDEAAAALSITIETARHYSKRLYAKTGARGLPDLVRLLLTSVASLA